MLGLDPRWATKRSVRNKGGASCEGGHRSVPAAMSSKRAATRSTSSGDALNIPLWGYPLSRTAAGQAALQGRSASGRSREAGWPQPARPGGGLFFGWGLRMSS